MKHMWLILITSCSFIKNYTSLPQSTSNFVTQQLPNNLNVPQQSAYKIFYSSPLTFNNQKSITGLIETVPSYPTFGTIKNGQTLHQGMQNRSVKAAVPKKVSKLLQTSKLTLFKTTPDAFKTYPKGEQLFKGYPEVAQKFDAMINGFASDPTFIPLFRKVHINVLNELYHYLMGIFMNFNLHHPGIIQNEAGDLQVNVSKFLESEELYDMNKKTMIINHLIGIIESQFNGAIRSYAHHMPQSFATYIGKTVIQNDYSTDLTQLITEQIEPQLKNLKASSLQALANYVSFFQLMTSYLNIKNSPKSTYFCDFVDMAEQVNQFLYGDTQSNQSIIAQMKAKAPSAYLASDLAIASEKFVPKLQHTVSPIKTASVQQLQSTSQLFSDDTYLIALAKMNPPILNFRYDDMRALKTIPYLAQKLSPTSKSIPWPEHIVEAANEGLLYNSGGNPHPVAYFKTKDNKVVQNYANDASSDLYICMRLGDNVFEQIVIAQPDWLNSWEGILNIMRACYGDFTAIAGMGILDPCMEALVTSVQSKTLGKAPANSAAIYQKAEELINSWKGVTTQTSQTTNTTLGEMNLPSLPSLPQLQESPFLNETPTLLAQP
jgi:hypothetical protein